MCQSTCTSAFSSIFLALFLSISHSHFSFIPAQRILDSCELWSTHVIIVSSTCLSRHTHMCFQTNIISMFDFVTHSSNPSHRVAVTCIDFGNCVKLWYLMMLKGNHNTFIVRNAAIYCIICMCGLRHQMHTSHWWMLYKQRERTSCVWIMQKRTSNELKRNTCDSKYQWVGPTLCINNQQ